MHTNSGDPRKNVLRKNRVSTQWVFRFSVSRSFYFCRFCFCSTFFLNNFSRSGYEPHSRKADWFLEAHAQRIEVKESPDFISTQNQIYFQHIVLEQYCHCMGNKSGNKLTESIEIMIIMTTDDWIYPPSTNSFLKMNRLMFFLLCSLHLQISVLNVIFFTKPIFHALLCALVLSGLNVKHTTFESGAEMLWIYLAPERVRYAGCANADHLWIFLDQLTSVMIPITNTFIEFN